MKTETRPIDLTKPVVTRASIPVTIVSTNIRPKAEDDPYTVAGYVGDDTDLSYWDKDGFYNKFHIEHSWDLHQAPITSSLVIVATSYNQLRTFDAPCRDVADSLVETSRGSLFGSIIIPFNIQQGVFHV